MLDRPAVFSDFMIDFFFW